MRGRRGSLLRRRAVREFLEFAAFALFDTLKRKHTVAMGCAAWFVLLVLAASTGALVALVLGVTIE